MPQLDGPLEAMLKKLRAAHDTTARIIADIDAYANSEPSENQLARNAVVYFQSCWEERYKSAYHIDNWRAAIAGLKRVVQGYGPTETMRRVKAFIDSNDPFYRQAKHPLPMFEKAVNKFAPANGDGDGDDIFATPPTDCPHLPRCRTDVQCTRRSQ